MGDPQFTKDYHDPAKRSIANALTVTLDNGIVLDEVIVEYPIGHRLRREEGIPKLLEKFRINLARKFTEKQQQNILALSLDFNQLINTPVNEFVDTMII